MLAKAYICVIRTRRQIKTKRGGFMLPDDSGRLLWCVQYARQSHTEYSLCSASPTRPHVLPSTPLLVPSTCLMWRPAPRSTIRSLSTPATRPFRRPLPRPRTAQPPAAASRSTFDRYSTAPPSTSWDIIDGAIFLTFTILTTVSFDVLSSVIKLSGWSCAACFSIIHFMWT